jgi:peptide/nickel transport system substrate-binding protein
LKKSIYALGILGLSACVSHIPRDPGVLVREISLDPPFINPILETDVDVRKVSATIFETLLSSDNQTLKPIPWLAHRWEVSPDGLIYTFHMRDDVKWSDGVPLTSADVVYSYGRIMDPKIDAASLRNYYNDIEKVEALDEHTVRFRFVRPYFLALDFCGGMPIIPKHIFDNGEDFNSHPANHKPVGTGPFMLKHWEAGKYLLVERNPHYWHHEREPKIKGMQFLIIPEQNTSFQMLKKGGMDLMESMRPIQWVRQTGSAKFKERFEKYKYFSPGLSYIGWNNVRPFFSDKRVRQALSMLLNRQKIVEKISFGQAQLVSGPNYYFGPAYDRAIAPYPFDPQKAKQLLDESGWTDHDGDGIRDKEGAPFRFSFLYASGSVAGERIGSILREELANVGIQMELRPMEYSALKKQIIDRNFDALAMGWGGGTVETDNYQLFHSSQIAQGSNHIGFNNPQADRLMTQIRSEVNPEKRYALQYELHALLHDEEPYTFMHMLASLAAVDRRFTDVVAYPLGFDLNEWGYHNVIRYME